MDRGILNQGNSTFRFKQIKFLPDKFFRFFGKSSSLLSILPIRSCKIRVLHFHEHLIKYKILFPDHQKCQLIHGYKSSLIVYSVRSQSGLPEKCPQRVHNAINDVCPILAKRGG